MPVIRTLNRYVFREMAVPFLLSISILTLTALLSKVIKIIELMVTHGVGASFVLKFITSVIPSFLIYTIPISFLIGVLIGFTRLSSDSEVTAMKASGVSLFNLMRPVAALALIAFAATLACTLYLFPWGNLNVKKLLFDAARSKLVSGIEEKTFYDKFKGVSLYIDHVNTKTGEMDGLFISQSGGAGEPTLFFARSGVFSSSFEGISVYLKLNEGTIHKKTDDAYHLIDFSTYTLELSLTDGGPITSGDKSNRELYSGEMKKKIEAAKAKGEDPGPYVIDLHKRFALPFSIFVFAIVGVPLGIQKVRSARFTGFSIALGVVLSYYVTSTAFEAFGNKGGINPVFAVWASDMIFAVFGLYVLYRAGKDKPPAPEFIKGLVPWGQGGKDK